MWNQQPRQQNMETEQMAAMSGHRSVHDGSGVWVAFYSDHSGARLFASEIDALRHAVGTSMDVRYVDFGEDVFA